MSDTSIELPYERIAMDGGELPDGLHFPDQILFLALRYLYQSRKRGFLTTEAGRLEKKKLLDDYRCYKFQWEMGDEWVRRIKDSDLARAEFKKNPTVENAWKLIKILEGRHGTV